MNKCSGPNTILYKILNLLEKGISKQLADLFNFCLSSACLSIITQNSKGCTCLEKRFKARLS